VLPEKSDFVRREKKEKRGGGGELLSSLWRFRKEKEPLHPYFILIIRPGRRWRRERGGKTTFEKEEETLPD